MQISIDEFITSPKIKNIFPDLAGLYNKAYDLPKNVFNNSDTEVDTFTIYYLINNKVVALSLYNGTSTIIGTYCCYTKNSIDGPKLYTGLSYRTSIEDFISSTMRNIDENEIKESYPLFIQAKYRAGGSAFWLRRHSFITCLTDLTSDIWAVKASGILTEQTRGSLFKVPSKQMESIMSGGDKDLDKLVCLTDSIDVDIRSGEVDMNGWIVEVKRSV